MQGSQDVNRETKDERKTACKEKKKNKSVKKTGSCYWKQEKSDAERTFCLLQLT